MVKSLFWKLSFLGYSIIVPYHYRHIKMYEWGAHFSLPVGRVVSIIPVEGDGLK